MKIEKNLINKPIEKWWTCDGIPLVAEIMSDYIDVNSLLQETATEPDSSVNGGDEEELAPTSELLRTKATYRCPLCPKRFIPRSLPEVGRLRRHLINDHNLLNNGKDLCLICGAMYSTRWYIKRHIKFVHLQPPRPKNTWKNSGPRPPIRGPSVQCTFCFKEIPKHFIAIHLRAHYNKNSSLSLVNAQQKLDKPAQGRNYNCSQKSNQHLNEASTKKGNRDISLANYSIYDLLGTYLKHYQEIKGRVIESYPTVPSDESSEDDVVRKATPIQYDNNVINLDSDSDESDQCNLVYGALDGAHNSKLTMDSDVVLLKDDDDDRSALHTNISANSGHTQIRIENVMSLPALSASNESDSGAHVVDKSADVVGITADVLDISADVVDISEDVVDVSANVVDISANKSHFSEGEENISAGVEYVSAGEDEESADEEDIVAELEQYIEDNELMEELNSSNSSHKQKEHLPMAAKDSAPSETNSVEKNCYRDTFFF